MAELKEKVKEQEEAQYFALGTLRGILDWIKETNPSTYLGKEAVSVIGDRFQGIMRDWVDKSGELIAKTWALPNLLADKAIEVLTSAKTTSSSESK